MSLEDCLGVLKLLYELADAAKAQAEAAERSSELFSAANEIVSTGIEFREFQDGDFKLGDFAIVRVLHNGVTPGKPCLCIRGSRKWMPSFGGPLLDAGENSIVQAWLPLAARQSEVGVAEAIVRKLEDGLEACCKQTNFHWEDVSDKFKAEVRAKMTEIVNRELEKAKCDKLGSNWPVFTGTGWKVNHCGKWVDAPKPPMVYDHYTQSFSKASSD